MRNAHGWAKAVAASWARVRLRTHLGSRSVLEKAGRGHDRDPFDVDRPARLRHRRTRGNEQAVRDTAAFHQGTADKRAAASAHFLCSAPLRHSTCRTRSPPRSRCPPRCCHPAAKPGGLSVAPSGSKRQRWHGAGGLRMKPARRGDAESGMRTSPALLLRKVQEVAITLPPFTAPPPNEAELLTNWLELRIASCDAKMAPPSCGNDTGKDT